MIYVIAVLLFLGSFNAWCDLKGVRAELPEGERGPRWLLPLMAAFWWAAALPIIIEALRRADRGQACHFVVAFTSMVLYAAGFAALVGVAV